MHMLTMDHSEDRSRIPPPGGMGVGGHAPAAGYPRRCGRATLDYGSWVSHMRPHILVAEADPAFRDLHLLMLRACGWNAGPLEPDGDVPARALVIADTSREQLRQRLARWSAWQRLLDCTPLLVVSANTGLPAQRPTGGADRTISRLDIVTIDRLDHEVRWLLRSHGL